MRLIFRINVVVTCLLFATAAFAAESGHWSYEHGATGPEHWGDLEAASALCKTGKNQSPINLTDMIEGQLPEIEFKYETGGDLILNNGHTIQVNYQPGSSITLNNQIFELKQFHFHAPSENTIIDHRFPLEVHFVHADKDGHLAVIAVMFEDGKKNIELEKAWNRMPEKANDRNKLFITVQAGNLMPTSMDYYRFSGSLTTPPCTEGVTWLVMKKPVSASKEQIEKFSHTLHHPNNRPVQPVNARVIVK